MAYFNPLICRYTWKKKQLDPHVIVEHLVRKTQGLTHILLGSLQLMFLLIHKKLVQFGVNVVCTNTPDEKNQIFHSPSVNSWCLCQLLPGRGRLNDFICTTLKHSDVFELVGILLETSRIYDASVKILSFGLMGSFSASILYLMTKTLSHNV